MSEVYIRVLNSQHASICSDSTCTSAGIQIISVRFPERESSGMVHNRSMAVRPRKITSRARRRACRLQAGCLEQTLVQAPCYQFCAVKGSVRPGFNYVSVLELCFRRL